MNTTKQHPKFAATLQTAQAQILRYITPKQYLADKEVQSILNDTSITDEEKEKELAERIKYLITDVKIEDIDVMRATWGDVKIDYDEIKTVIKQHKEGHEIETDITGEVVNKGTTTSASEDDMPLTFDTESETDLPFTEPTDLETTYQQLLDSGMALTEILDELATTFMCTVDDIRSKLNISDETVVGEQPVWLEVLCSKKFAEEDMDESEEEMNW